MRQFIFLDVDGVLNNYGYARYRTEVMGYCSGYGGFFKEDDPISKDNVGWDPENVRAFKTILKEVPDAEIVLSSTWRLHFSVEKFYDMFDLYGIEGTILGKTKDLSLDIPSENFLFGACREKEVISFLKEVSGQEEINFVILDDYEQFPSLEDNFVNTNMTKGLTDQDAETAIKILREGPAFRSGA